MPVDQGALAATLQSLLRDIDLPRGTEGTALVGRLGPAVDCVRTDTVVRVPDLAGAPQYAARLGSGALDGPAPEGAA